jgi:hypothetical protein
MRRVMTLPGIFTANLYLSENNKNYNPLQGKAILQSGVKLQPNSSEFFNNLAISFVNLGAIVNSDCCELLSSTNEKNNCPGRFSYFQFLFLGSRCGTSQWAMGRLPVRLPWMQWLGRFDRRGQLWELEFSQNMKKTIYWAILEESVLSDLL